MNPVRHSGKKETDIPNKKKLCQYPHMSNGMNKLINGRSPLYRVAITGYGSFAPAKTLTND